MVPGLLITYVPLLLVVGPPLVDMVGVFASLMIFWLIINWPTPDEAANTQNEATHNSINYNTIFKYFY